MYICKSNVKARARKQVRGLKTGNYKNNASIHRVQSLPNFVGNLNASLLLLPLLLSRVPAVNAMLLHNDSTASCSYTDIQGTVHVVGSELFFKFIRQLDRVLLE